MTSQDFRNNPFFLRNQFKGTGAFQIPLIKKEDISLSAVELIGYDKVSERNFKKIVHFFLDDYKFETLWKNPEEQIEKLSGFSAVLSPQFSVFTEMPTPLKIFQTFKNRWCGAFLQSNGIRVIPSLAWGNSDTFSFCFEGIEKGSTVAVSTVGVRTEKELFLSGYKEMLRRINPSAIICYGTPFEEMRGNIIYVDYAKTNNLSRKSFYVHKTYSFDKGMGSASNIRIKTVLLSELPPSVQKSYTNYKRINWKGNYNGQNPGTRAGSAFFNEPPSLPGKASDGTDVFYREFDVNNKIPGQRRDGERFVVANNGRVFYTSDHYISFVEIIGG